uniref:DNA-directed RNA polymerase subunit beta'' n=1 Tax=Microglena monadina TaxID=47904 RepID=A0A0S2IBN0_9CHLO|nr:beta'' subunit of RNA polymerase [Microglena monadina]
MKFKGNLFSTKLDSKKIIRKYKKTNLQININTLAMDKNTSYNFNEHLNKSVLGNNNFFWNQCFDKNRLKNFVAWFLLNYGEHKTLELVEQLKTLGFKYATKAGISLGIDDLKIPPKKAQLIFQAEKITSFTIKQYKRGEITGVERFQRLIDSWHRTSENLKQEVIDYFESTDILNPVYMMAFSGARGNISQVRQLVGMRGLMANPQGQIIDYPIRSNFREGLTLTEYIISSYGARKGIVDTALRTANAGYLTRRLVDVAQHVIISNFDCKTNGGIFLSDMKEGNKIIYSLPNRLVGRVLARDIYSSNVFEKNTNSKKSNSEIAKKNTEISLDLSFEISKISKKVFVRSVLACNNKKLVCQLCYGWSLAQGNLVSIGEAVGVIAAQSIGEPGTQLTMRTFHTGGVFSGGVTDQIKAPFDGFIEYGGPIPGKLVRTPEGKIGFLTINEGFFIIYSSAIYKDVNMGLSDKKNQVLSPLKGRLPKLGFEEKFKDLRNQTKKYKIPVYTLLFKRMGESVFSKEVIAQISSLSKQKNATDDAELTIKSEIEGQFNSNGLLISRISVGPKLKKEEIYNKIPFDPLFQAFNWGDSWILSGKIYKLPLASSFFPLVGDFINRKTVMNQIKWKFHNENFFNAYSLELYPCFIENPYKDDFNQTSFHNILKNSHTRQSKSIIDKKTINPSDSLDRVAGIDKTLAKVKVKNKINFLKTKNLISSYFKNKNLSRTTNAIFSGIENTINKKENFTFSKDKIALEDLEIDKNLNEYNRKGLISLPIIKHSLLALNVKNILYKKYGYFVQITSGLNPYLILKHRISLIGKNFIKKKSSKFNELLFKSQFFLHPFNRGIEKYNIIGTEDILLLLSPLKALENGNNPDFEKEFSNNSKVKFERNDVYYWKSKSQLKKIKRKSNSSRVYLSTKKLNPFLNFSSCFSPANWVQNFKFFLNWYPANFQMHTPGLVSLERNSPSPSTAELSKQLRAKTSSPNIAKLVTKQKKNWAKFGRHNTVIQSQLTPSYKVTPATSPSFSLAREGGAKLPSKRKAGGVITELCSPSSSKRKTGGGVAKLTSPSSSKRKTGGGVAKLTSPSSSKRKDGGGVAKLTSPSSSKRKDGGKGLQSWGYAAKSCENDYDKNINPNSIRKNINLGFLPLKKERFFLFKPIKPKENFLAPTGLLALSKVDLHSEAMQRNIDLLPSNSSLYRTFNNVINSNFNHNSQNFRKRDPETSFFSNSLQRLAEPSSASSLDPQRFSCKKLGDKAMQVALSKVKGWRKAQPNLKVLFLQDKSKLDKNFYLKIIPIKKKGFIKILSLNKETKYKFQLNSISKTREIEQPFLTYEKDSLHKLAEQSCLPSMDLPCKQIRAQTSSPNIAELVAQQSCAKFVSKRCAPQLRWNYKARQAALSKGWLKSKFNNFEDIQKIKSWNSNKLVSSFIKKEFIKKILIKNNTSEFSILKKEKNKYDLISSKIKKNQSLVLPNVQIYNYSEGRNTNLLFDLPKSNKNLDSIHFNIRWKNSYNYKNAQVKTFVNKIKKTTKFIQEKQSIMNIKGYESKKGNSKQLVSNPRNKEIPNQKFNLIKGYTKLQSKQSLPDLSLNYSSLARIFFIPQFFYQLNSTFSVLLNENKIFSSSNEKPFCYQINRQGFVKFCYLFYPKWQNIQKESKFNKSFAKKFQKESFSVQTKTPSNFPLFPSISYCISSKFFRKKEKITKINSRKITKIKSRKITKTKIRAVSLKKPNSTKKKHYNKKTKLAKTHLKKSLNSYVDFLIKIIKKFIFSRNFIKRNKSKLNIKKAIDNNYLQSFSKKRNLQPSVNSWNSDKILPIKVRDLNKVINLNGSLINLNKEKLIFNLNEFNKDLKKKNFTKQNLKYKIIKNSYCYKVTNKKRKNQNSFYDKKTLLVIGLTSSSSELKRNQVKRSRTNIFKKNESLINLSRLLYFFSSTSVNLSSFSRKIIYVLILKNKLNISLNLVNFVNLISLYSNLRKDNLKKTSQQIKKKKLLKLNATSIFDFCVLSCIKMQSEKIWSKANSRFKNFKKTKFNNYKILKVYLRSISLINILSKFIKLELKKISSSINKRLTLINKEIAKVNNNNFKYLATNRNKFNFELKNIFIKNKLLCSKKDIFKISTNIVLKNKKFTSIILQILKQNSILKENSLSLHSSKKKNLLKGNSYLKSNHKDKSGKGYSKKVPIETSKIKKKNSLVSIAKLCKPKITGATLAKVELGNSLQENGHSSDLEKLSLQIKFGWIYFPNNFNLDSKYNKKYFFPGQIFLDNLIFDNHICYLEFISLDKLEKNSNLTKNQDLNTCNMQKEFKSFHSRIDSSIQNQNFHYKYITNYPVLIKTKSNSNLGNLKINSTSQIIYKDFKIEKNKIFKKSLSFKQSCDWKWVINKKARYIPSINSTLFLEELKTLAKAKVNSQFQLTPPEHSEAMQDNGNFVTTGSSNKVTTTPNSSTPIFKKPKKVYHTELLLNKARIEANYPLTSYKTNKKFAILIRKVSEYKQPNLSYYKNQVYNSLNNCFIRTLSPLNYKKIEFKPAARPCRLNTNGKFPSLFTQHTTTLPIPLQVDKFIYKTNIKNNLDKISLNKELLYKIEVQKLFQTSFIFKGLQFGKEIKKNFKYKQNFKLKLLTILNNSFCGIIYNSNIKNFLKLNNRQNIENKLSYKIHSFGNSNKVWSTLPSSAMLGEGNIINSIGLKNGNISPFCTRIIKIPLKKISPKLQNFFCTEKKLSLFFNKKYFFNKSYHSSNFNQEFKNSLINKQKITIQTISKFPNIDLKIFSNLKFYYKPFINSLNSKINNSILNKKNQVKLELPFGKKVNKSHKNLLSMNSNVPRNVNSKVLNNNKTYFTQPIFYRKPIIHSLFMSYEISYGLRGIFDKNFYFFNYKKICLTFNLQKFNNSFNLNNVLEIYIGKLFQQKNKNFTLTNQHSLAELSRKYNKYLAIGMPSSSQQALITNSKLTEIDLSFSKNLKKNLNQDKESLIAKFLKNENILSRNTQTTKKKEILSLIPIIFNCPYFSYNFIQKLDNRFMLDNNFLNILSKLDFKNQNNFSLIPKKVEIQNQFFTSLDNKFHSSNILGITSSYSAFEGEIIYRNDIRSINEYLKKKLPFNFKNNLLKQQLFEKREKKIPILNQNSTLILTKQDLISISFKQKNDKLASLQIFAQLSNPLPNNPSAQQGIEIGGLAAGDLLRSRRRRRGLESSLQSSDMLGLDELLKDLKTSKRLKYLQNKFPSIANQNLTSGGSISRLDLLSLPARLKIIQKWKKKPKDLMLRKSRSSLEEINIIYPKLLNLLTKYHIKNILQEFQNQYIRKTAYYLNDIIFKYKKITRVRKTSSCSIYTLNKMIIGLPISKTGFSLGEFFKYGDKLKNNLTILQTGQIVHLSKEKMTLRQGQRIKISINAILHKKHQELVNSQSAVLTLSYSQLKTGDIVQGIPKIEQFFEARTTKRGRLFRDSLPHLLESLFKHYQSYFSIDKAARQSLYKIQEILIDGVQRVYRGQGVTIADKHLEIIVKQMTSKARILKAGSTGYFPGDVEDLFFIEKIYQSCPTGIEYEPLILGISKTSLEVKSFLSAASFQHTTRVLTKAAINREKDYLSGLKENVLLGNLIPSGIGYLVSLESKS